MELLYPFPAIDLERLLEPYADGVEFVWVQEEPQNMGAWFYVAPAFRENTGRDIRYIGRPRRASPAEGYADVHEKEQKRLTSEAVRPAAAQKRARRR
jgi:2-oxoglutarate dehydrogenase E1 component